ncbi:hypothetical protein A0H81_11778 [Grifola frondosa]|uniref:DUF6533 domain-containing protein n=1 Tax=Grifola frondosa TaxID=5627 RepID=A0A1C7LZR2_GRIFR|nr:hypothetical protein A0H81_11778 [Grifola frondosa]
MGFTDCGISFTALRDDSSFSASCSRPSCLGTVTMSFVPPMASEQDSNTVAELITSIENVHMTQFVSFIAATIVVYDYIICIEREVELIWQKRWSVIKLAFIWHRYFGLSCMLFQVIALNSTAINDALYVFIPVRIDQEYQGRFWFHWETWGYCSILFSSEAVLLLWIYVVYNKSRWILAVMGFLYVTEVVAVVMILAFSFIHFDANSHTIPGTTFCVIGSVPSTYRLLWVPILAFDSILLLLFLYRGCGRSLRCGRKRTFTYDNLLDMVYKHSLMNFLAIFASYLSCAIIWLVATPGLYQIPVAFALALSITNCTRLLINIRRAYYIGVDDPLLINIRDIPQTGTNTPVLSEIPMTQGLLMQLRRVTRTSIRGPRSYTSRRKSTRNGGSTS